MRALATIAVAVAGVMFLAAGLGFAFVGGLGGGATNLVLAGGLVAVGGSLLIHARAVGDREQKPRGARRQDAGAPAAAPRAAAQMIEQSQQQQILADPAAPRPERGGPTQPPPVQML